MHRLKSVALAVSLSMLTLSGAQVHAASSDEVTGEEAAAEPPPPKATVKEVLSVGHKKNDAARKSQVRIDKLAAETRDLLADYKTVMKQVDGLKVYNARLEKQITNQIRRIKELEKSIDEATVIQRQMMPTIIKMIDGLEEFVRLDVPFHAVEREQRIEFLRNNLDRSDVSIAEKFRDEGRDILMFIDNIFRFTQAGSEVSALLGRMPSAVGYQPTLATDMAALQERITSTKKGSITSVQAVYVPADDLTDPAPATTFGHLDATVVLSRKLASMALFPAVDPFETRASRGRTLLGSNTSARIAPTLQRASRCDRHPRYGRAFRRRQDCSTTCP